MNVIIDLIEVTLVLLLLYCLFDLCVNSYFRARENYVLRILSMVKFLKKEEVSNG